MDPPLHRSHYSLVSSAHIKPKKSGGFFMSVIDVGRKAVLLMSGAFALGITAETAVFAQEPAPAPQTLEEITVTGSRIVRSNYSAQTPIVTVGKEDFESRMNVGLEAT